MTTDAATAVLVALRTRVQGLHEALGAVETADDPAHGTAAGLRDAAARLALLLASMHPVLDPARTDGPRRQLEALAATAGTVRDAEVLGDLLADALGDVPRALVAGPLADRVRRHLRERRTQAADVLAKTVRAEDCAAVVRTVDRLVITPPLGPGAGAKATKVLARCARADDEALAGAIAAVQEGTSDTGWAGVRDAALALAGSAGAAATGQDKGPGKKATKLASAADELAARVDDLLDTGRARRLLVDLADLAHRHREPGFTYGVLHAEAGRRGELAFARVEVALAAIDRDKLRSWF